MQEETATSPITDTGKRTCRNPTCGKTISGRSEKIFCNPVCRYAYNNTLKTEETRVTAFITNTLKKNRRIMNNVLRDKQSTSISENRLMDLGFNIHYYTHHFVTKKQGIRYTCCYDLGYRQLDDGCYLIVRRYKEY